MWTVEQALPTAPEAAAVLRLYLAEMISRFHGRETDEAEVDRHLREGNGSAGRLLAAAEEMARELGAGAIRLKTRSDLVEARAMYAKHGYVEIPRYGDDEFADHWFEKMLGD